MTAEDESSKPASEAPPSEAKPVSTEHLRNPVEKGAEPGLDKQAMVAHLQNPMVRSDRPTGRGLARDDTPAKNQRP